MTKLNHRTTGTNGVEWQAVGPDEEPFGPWRPNQHDARKDDPLNGQAVPQPDGYSLDEGDEKGVVYLSQPYKVWE